MGNNIFVNMEASNEVAELLGAKLVKGDGTETDFNQWYGEFKGTGKYIGLYYGAHWAPPSRLFTRNLKEKFYDPVKGSDAMVCNPIRSRPFDANSQIKIRRFRTSHFRY